jgi:hypothetical protein
MIPLLVNGFDSLMKSLISTHKRKSHSFSRTQKARQQHNAWKDAMNVLFIGDIVGPDATAYVARRLPELRQRYALDLVIANGENCAISATTP